MYLNWKITILGNMYIYIAVDDSVFVYVFVVVISIYDVVCVPVFVKKKSNLGLTKKKFRTNQN